MHKEENGSLNYADRSKKVMRFLAEDLQEASGKMQALVQGIKLVYGKEFVVPDIYTSDALDNIVIVARQIARFLEIETIRDINYDVVIPLAQPWLMKNGRAEALVDSRKLQRTLKSGDTLAFDLKNVFVDQDRVRLRSVGLSFGNKLALDQRDPGRLSNLSAYRLSGALWLPVISVNGEELERPPLYFGDISVYAGSAGTSVNTSTACYNVDPGGVWRLRINPRAVWSMDTETTLTDLFYDIKLHLSVTAIFTPGVRLENLPPQDVYES